MYKKGFSSFCPLSTEPWRFSVSLLSLRLLFNSKKSAWVLGVNDQIHLRRELFCEEFHVETVCKNCDLVQTLYDMCFFVRLCVYSLELNDETRYCTDKAI